MTDQFSLFVDDETQPPGFDLRRDFISEEEEGVLISRIAELALAPFQFGAFEGKRRVASFGWRYDYSYQQLRQANPTPPWLVPIVQRIEQTFGLSAGAIQQILCTEYDDAAGIGWHRDKPQFGEIFGLSLASACKFRFRRRVGDAWQRLTFDLGPRSFYRMSGASRKIWEHSIPPVPARRYSVTFRTMAIPADRGGGTKNSGEAR